MRLPHRHPLQKKREEATKGSNHNSTYYITHFISFMLGGVIFTFAYYMFCLLYTSPSPRD